MMKIYKKLIAAIVLILIVIGCNDVKVKEKIVNNKLNNEDTIMITDVQKVEFHDLFNEGSIIKFSPNDIANNQDPEINEFKRKLKLYESQHTIIEDFEPNDIKLLINDDTFFESKSYINSEWFNYFLTKYKLSYTYNELMELAIKQEDLEATKILIIHKYIFSIKDLSIAEDTKENQMFELKENRKQGYDSYLLSNSKIDDILKLILTKYNSNRIYDNDGYTNLRDGKGVNFSIIAKINSGEHIKVLNNPDEDDWYLIETIDNKKGYIHKSRIVSE